MSSSQQHEVQLCFQGAASRSVVSIATLLETSVFGEVKTETRVEGHRPSLAFGGRGRDFWRGWIGHSVPSTIQYQSYLLKQPY